MTETAIKQVVKATKKNVMAELDAAIDDDALAVVTFVIKEPNDDSDESNVKVLALMPPGAAESIEPIIHEAYDELLLRSPRHKKESNDVVYSIHGKTFDQLPPAVQAYWEFNEDLAQLLDILVERNLVREPIGVFYTPLKQFVRDGDFISVPELFKFVEEGPQINGDMIPALCWIVAAHLSDIDPLNPPDDFTESSAADIAKIVEAFLYRVAEKELISCV
jgi:hypothetical protein